jgi:sulfite reductase alpha subunit-like flavoprotein
MAKKSFKDMIFKFLKKDEEAPANATGTAVAGTGDDSSTVVVKKKKELQKKLMTRMGIKEAIDKAIPDLEYPKDEIRERANELKKLASKSKDKRAPIYKQQAKNIAKAAKIPHNFNKKEGAAVPKDKDTDQPKKYVSGLSDKDKRAHDKHLEKGSKKADDDKSAYKQSPADKKAKTKPSKHTNKFKQMYGEDYLNEKIKGLETKAKKSGMPYSILKKVYDRGMAAWKGGHRPGTTPQQWAFARVNSFTTKSSGTWGKADKDLAKQVRGS